jgi:hypothetical protein
MSYEIPIVGPHQIPGFNGTGVINLEDYYTVEIPEMEGYQFEYISSLDLSTVDEYEEIWLNDHIRDEGNTEERIENFVVTFEVGGFKTKHTPPQIITDGKPIDGRGRVIAAKRRGEKYIPVLVYSRIDKSELCRLANALIRNLEHDPASKATRKDVIATCLGAINSGELECEETDVRSFLMNRVRVHRYFNAGNITIIVNEVIKLGKAGASVVRVQDRKAHEHWIDKNLGIKVDNKKTWLFSVDQPTYTYRALCEAVLDSVINDKDPAQIILYTNLTIPQDARERLKKFVTDLDKFVNASYKMVAKDIFADNHQMISAFKCNNKPYVILGARAQFIGEHDLNAKSLVPIENY